MADVFLSYRNSPLRRRYVERLRIALDAYGISAWWDFGLEAGADFEDQIFAELNTASLICPIWCCESIKSKWVFKEASVGIDQDKILPIRLQSVTPPSKFELIQSHDLVDWSGSTESYQITSLASAITNRLGTNLQPIPDKLRVLGSLPALPPLGKDANEESPLATLLIERAKQMSLGATMMDLFWNGERIGEIKRGKSIEFKILSGRGELQLGMRHATEKEMIFSEPLTLTLQEGRTSFVRLKVDKNLYGYPKVNFWVDTNSVAIKKDWKNRI